MSKGLAHDIENVFRRIREILSKARKQVYQTANIEMLQAYWNIGREIIEEEQNGKDRADYGAYLIKQLSLKLTDEYGKGFTVSNLKYMRQFYQVFEKGHALRGQLTWTHYRILLKVEKEGARQFYIEEAIAGGWSTRQLERQVNSLFYERTLMSRDKKGMLKDVQGESSKMLPENIIRDPYVLEFLNVKENEKLAEKELETALIDKLQQFILELGKGFAFVARQHRVTTETGKHFRIDLVFYNYILKCFLLIDLKTDELSHQDIGQMDMYVGLFEAKMKQPGDNPTIGLILCTEKDRTIVKYSLLNESKQIFASKYQLYLPTEKQLQEELEREKEQIEMERKLKG